MTNINDQINEELSQGEVGAYSFVKSKLNELKDTYGAEVPDASTKDGYIRSKSIASEMRALRTDLEKKRKEIKAPALAYGKLIDSTAKELTEQIKSIEEPHLNAYREVDAEKKRLKEEAEQKLLSIRELPSTCFDKTSEQIESMIDELASVSIDKETFRHKLEDAEQWIPSILNQLSLEHAKAIEREEEARRIEVERLELEELRRRQAEQQAKEQAEREAKERAEREKQIAEQAAREAEERAEREKQAAIDAAEKAEREKQEAIKQAEIEKKEAAERAEREKQAAIEAERQRQEQEQLRKQVEAKAREEDLEHRKSINNQALQAFVDGGFSEKQSKEIVKLIASKQVPFVTINY